VSTRLQIITAGLVATMSTAVASAQTAKPVAPAARGTTSTPTTPEAEAKGTPTPESQTGYTYDPAGRRDPFINLVRRGTDSARAETPVRPPGLAGIGVGELTLKGMMQSRTGYVALVQGPDNKTYIVKPGDQLLDGTIRTITADTMVLLQQIDDPLSSVKQREVRKVLRQVDEVK
jgi:Tfp pilus assembly protein PilP